MKDGTCRGYIFARQKFESIVKSVGKNTLKKTDEKIALVMKVKKNTSQLMECEQ